MIRAIVKPLLPTRTDKREQTNAPSDTIYKTLSMVEGRKAKGKPPIYKPFHHTRKAYESALLIHRTKPNDELIKSLKIIFK